MVRKYGYCMTKSHIDEIWNRTLTFWQEKKAKIRQEFISDTGLYRTLIVRKGMFMHMYATSYGETYEMTFGFDPSEELTYISVYAKFSVFGKGFVWLVPDKMMEEWANAMIIPPMKLKQKQNPKYMQKFNEISNLSSHQAIDQIGKFCPVCGKEHATHHKFCEACGTKLVIS